MADDNRVLKAWAELTPDQQQAMLKRWGSEKAWYLCKYTTTIATGLRDGFDASELAKHYKISLEAVKLAREVAKGSVIEEKKKEAPGKEEFEEESLPPGAVQGPIIPPTPPSETNQETEDSKEIDPDEVEEAPKKKKKARSKKKKTAKKKAEAEKNAPEESTPEEAAPEPKEESKKWEGPPPFHPKAQVEGRVREGKTSKSEKESDSPFHPNAQVNQQPSRVPEKPPGYEESKSYKVLRDQNSGR